MAITAKKHPPDSQVPAPGLQQAFCVGIVVLGLQIGEYKGKKTLSQKVQIFFKLNNFFWLIGKLYTLSMGQQANLRRDLENWFGPFESDDAANEFDLEQILGKRCCVDITHKPGASRTYANIQRILPPAEEGDAEVIPENELFCFDIHSPDMEVFARLPAWVQRQLEDSPEWGVHQQAT